MEFYWKFIVLLFSFFLSDLFFILSSPIFSIVAIFNNFDE